MKFLTLFEIETGKTSFALVITSNIDGQYVARYWNIPRRNSARVVRQTTPQWSGEVSSPRMEDAMLLAKAEMEFLDGPIKSCSESPLYRKQAMAASTFGRA